MVHLFYGDSANDAFTCFNKRGKRIIFREALLSGPAGLPSPEFSLERAQYLATAYDTSYEECRDDLEKFERELAAVPPEEELVLWFGRDLFCQIALIYILVRLGETRTTNVSLVCPNGSDEDVFCFGDIAPAELNDYLQAREPVRTLDFQHAAIAWHLYASEDAEALNAIFDGSLEVGARFASALEQHAARFPSSRDSLGETQRHILMATQSHAVSFSELFAYVAKRTRHITWGDSQVRGLCEELAACKPALLLQEGDTWQCTPEGTSLMTGERVQVARPPHWLGGCEVSGEPTWLWDADARRIVAA